MKLPIKTLTQIIVLFGIFMGIAVTLILNYLNLNQLQEKNIEIYSKNVTKTKKDSIHGNIDLAKEIIKSYYNKKEVYGSEFLLGKKELLLRQLNSLYDYYKDELSKGALGSLIKSFSSKFGFIGWAIIL